MTEFLKGVLTGQYEAVLAMFRQRIEVCPEEYWDGKAGADSFRQVAYHGLFYFDYYLSPTEESFSLRPLHEKGGDERGEALCSGLSKGELLVYIDLCHQKILDQVARETEDSLKGNSGFTRRTFSRTELHIYNIRHIQHHTGQLSSYIREISDRYGLALKLPWVGSGWQQPT